MKLRFEWTSNCIGVRNYKYFLRFLLFLLILISHTIYLNFQLVMSHTGPLLIPVIVLIIICGTSVLFNFFMAYSARGAFFFRLWIPGCISIVYIPYLFDSVGENHEWALDRTEGCGTWPYSKFETHLLLEKSEKHVYVDKIGEKPTAHI